MKAWLQTRVVGGLKCLVSAASEKMAEIRDLDPLQRQCCVNMVFNDGWDKTPDFCRTDAARCPVFTWGRKSQTPPVAAPVEPQSLAALFFHPFVWWFGLGIAITYFCWTVRGLRKARGSLGAVPVAQWPQMADPNAVLPPASQLAVLAPLETPAAPWPPLSPFPPAAALGVAIPLDLPAVAAASPWWPPLNLFLPAAALGAVIPVGLPPPAPAAAAAAAAPDAAAAAVTAKPPTGGYFQHPLGCMFCPELDKAGVLAVVSEVLCAPGFVSGPSEEARLLRSVGSGRIDIQTMSRLLRWLRGERAARELRGRGVDFVGPETDDVVRPITTGLGMSHLMKEVIACGYPAGTQFVVAFSSSSDACSGVISGVLTATAQEPRSESKSDSKSLLPVSELAPTAGGGGGGGAGSDSNGGRRSKQGGSVESTPVPDPGQEVTRTASSPSFSLSSSSPPPPSPSCSRFVEGAAGKARVAGSPESVSAMPSARASSSASGKSVTATTRSGSGGDSDGGGGGGDLARRAGRRTPHHSRRKRAPYHSGGGSRGGGISSNNLGDHSRTDVLAHLFDEVPTHCRGRRSGAGDGGGGGGCVDASGGEGLTKMEVEEWASIYGECDGPLLAAWVFPGVDSSRPPE